MIDSFEFSKIAGAFLFALLAIFGPRAAIDIWQEGAHKAEQGFTLPTAAPAAATPAAGGAAAPAAFDPAAVVAMIAKANPQNGEATIKKCLACHTDSKSEGSKLGPNLWGVVGRPKASRADFAGYSDAMKAKGGDWTYLDLATFIHSPKTFVPGTKMIFAGISDPSDIADRRAYIRTLADTPAPLPQ